MKRIIVANAYTDCAGSANCMPADLYDDLIDFCQDYGKINYRHIQKLDSIWDQISVTTQMKIKDYIDEIQEDCELEGMSAYEAAKEYEDIRETCQNLVGLVNFAIGSQNLKK